MRQKWTLKKMKMKLLDLCSKLVQSRTLKKKKQKKKRINQKQKNIEKYEY